MSQPLQLNGHLRLNKGHFLSAVIPFVAVLIFPLLLSSCAQLNQLMGLSADSTETAQPAPVQEPASQAKGTAPSGQPATRQSTGTGSPDTKPTGKPVLTPSAKAGAATAQPAGPDSKQASDRAVAEKDQPKKDKKSSVASDKRSAKKPSKPEAPSRSEDAFLPPIPLPSKPAAIGGSGG